MHKSTRLLHKVNYILFYKIKYYIFENIYSYFDNNLKDLKLFNKKESKYLVDSTEQESEQLGLKNYREGNKCYIYDVQNTNTLKF